MKSMEKSIQKLIEKGKITETATVILERIRPTTSMEEFSSVELVIEAATENKELKKKIFLSLDGILKKSAIILTDFQ